MHRDTLLEASAQGGAGDYRIRIGERETTVSGARLSGDTLNLHRNGKGERFLVRRRGHALAVHDGERRLHLRLADRRRNAAAAAGTEGRIMAPMPGRIAVVRSKPGDVVTAGQELLVMEAMKMELALKAPRDGVVAEMRAVAGEFAEADAVLVVLE